MLIVLLMKVKLKLHWYIFLFYLIVCQLFLFNRAGGGDIAYIFFLCLFIFLHLSTLFVLILIDYFKKREKIYYQIFLIMIGIFSFTLISTKYYLDFVRNVLF